jgi:hypothetical protein
MKFCKIGRSKASTAHNPSRRIIVVLCPVADRVQSQRARGVRETDDRFGWVGFAVVASSCGACDLDGLGRSLAVAGIPGRPRRPGLARPGRAWRPARGDGDPREAGEKNGDWRGCTAEWVSDRQRVAGGRGRRERGGVVGLERDGVRCGLLYYVRRGMPGRPPRANRATRRRPVDLASRGLRARQAASAARAHMQRPTVAY